ncbi:MAG: hypothetical protein INR64_16935, partial [Caulobacteraceae bacterium]|nr:hypothetical protein [Caulobacter sp.]
MSDRLAGNVRVALRTTSQVLRAYPGAGSRLANTTLADRYDLSKSCIYVNGAQAVVRTLLMQHELDKRAGHRTAGFVS